jgi:electron transfer flavoprotein-quinone oxidoreductase
LLEESVVLQDLYKIRNVTSFAHARPHLLREYPQLAAEIAREYLSVDGSSKKDKQRRIARMVGSLPKRRLVSDVVGALRAMT